MFVFHLEYGTPNASKISCLCRLDRSSFSRLCRDVWIEARSRERVFKNVPTIDPGNDLENVPRIDPGNVLENVPRIDPGNVLENVPRIDSGNDQAFPAFSF